MADNVTITSGANSTPPAGTVVSTDEAASGHVQRVKLTLSADGSDTHLQADADGLLVNLGMNNDVTVTSGTITLGASAVNIGDVDVLTVPAPLSTTGGGTEATALRVTIANDSTGLVSVDDNGGSITVDNTTLTVVGGGTEATALRVTVASDSTGVLSVDDNGSSLTIDNAALSVTGSGTETGALRVTLATDSTGVLSVDDNGGTLTVDAPVGTPVNVQIGDGSLTATVRNTGTSDSLNVAIVDASGAQVTSFGGGTQYTEGDTDATITGTAIMWEDSGDTLRPVSDSLPLPVLTKSGSVTSVTGTVTVDSELPTAQSVGGGITPSASPSVIAWPYVYDGGTQWNRTREAATDITGTGVIGSGLMAQLDDVATGTVTENNLGLLRMSSARRLLVDGSGVTQPVSGNITADTELPAAAALTDNFANPTAPAVGAFGMIWDGVAWDRVPGNSTDGVFVKVTNTRYPFL